MGVVSRRFVWEESMGVVVRRYIGFLILLIPTPLVSTLFCSNIPTFCSFLYVYHDRITLYFISGLATLIIMAKHSWCHTILLTYFCETLQQ